MLPFEISRKYKTSTDNQKIVELVILSDAEDGNLDKIASGFFTIAENLPVDSNLTFTFNLTESEELSVTVKVDKTGKKTNVVLGRGNKDSKCLKEISESLEQVLGDSSISDSKKSEFTSKIQEVIDTISAGNLKEDASEWQDLENKTNLATNDAHLPDESNESTALIIAKILLGTFSRYISSEDESDMRENITKAEDSSNPMGRVVALKKLESLTEKYSLFTTMFMFKIVAMGNSLDPATAARADKAFVDMMKALERHDVDTVRDLISSNSDLLRVAGGGIDIKTALKNG